MCISSNDLQLENASSSILVTLFGIITDVIFLFRRFGIVLVLITFVFSALSTLVLPGSVSKWAILSPTIVPSFMNEGLTPELATLVFRAGECVTYGITPIMAYFVIYLAFMELYTSDNEEGLFGNIKYLIPYSVGTLLMWIVIILLFYVTGIPFGIGGYVGL